MFDVIFILFAVIFLVSLVVVGYGFYRHAKLSGQIFTLAQREIDRKSAESEEPKTVNCSHCGARVPAGRDCPGCGAPLSV